MSQDALAVRQTRMLHLLGRCVLRFQQYERLIKAMLAAHHITAEVGRLRDAHAENLEEVNDRTLGALTRRLFDTVIVPEGASVPGFDDRRPPPGDAVVLIRRTIELPRDDHAVRLQAALRLVGRRNELIHHFSAQYDLHSVAGCENGSRQLAAVYQDLDLQHRDLIELARGMTHAETLQASWERTQTFQDMVLRGIPPSVPVDWEASEIVVALREALTALGADPWVRLDRVEAWMKVNRPGLHPSAVGCRSWRQVLHDSRRFDIRRDAGESVGRVIRYRQRVGNA